MQQAIGLALVTLQAALMGLLARTVGFPMFVVMLAAFGTVTKWRISLSREQAFLLSTAAAFFFLLKHRFSPQDFPVGSEFIRTEVAFIIAQFLLFIEAGQFILRRDDDRLSPVLPALGAVALICIADVQITPEQRQMTQIFAIAYALLWALFLWAGRNPMPIRPTSDAEQQSRRVSAQRRRLATFGLVLLVMAATAWGASLGLYEFEKKIEGWLLGLMAGSNSQVRFSRSARLGSLAHKKTQAEEDLALWTYSKEFPGYMRGAVFARFESSEWKAQMEFNSLDANPVTNWPKGLKPAAESELLFAHPSVTPAENANWQKLECWLAGDQESAAFTPLGTAALMTKSEEIGILPFELFAIRNVEKCNPYFACVPDSLSKNSRHLQPDERWLEIPADQRPILLEMARAIFRKANTPEEKIAAVEQYFHGEYQYHLGIEIPNGEDPLTYFLREKPPAHCEYFATAATLLLRTQGIPARYVTGLVPGEWNVSGGYWAARNRDAHAWAEAYLDSKGWVTVEATPSEGIPEHNRKSKSFAFWEALKRDWQRLRTFLSQNRWKELGQLLVSTWLGGLVFFFLLAFLTYLAIRIPWPNRFRRRRADDRDPRLAAIRQLLMRMDQVLLQYGLRRNNGETLHQFAERIGYPEEWKAVKGESSAQSSNEQADEAANWYRDYARLRYQGFWSEADLEGLRSRLPES